MMTDEQKQEQIDRHVKSWHEDWQSLVDGIMAGTGLTRIEAMLFMLLSNSGALAAWARTQLDWWGSEERKTQDAERDTQQANRDAVLQRMAPLIEKMADEMDEDEDWKGET